jgi:hypothetical protein
MSGFIILDKKNIKIAVENYYLSLSNKLPASKIINNEVNKIHEVFKNGKYIDQNWLIYDGDKNVIYDNAGSFSQILNQGFINEANKLVNNLIKINVRR